MKLEFGCGPKITKGYVGVDVRQFKHVKYVCNAWEIDKYVEPQTVEAIYSRHFFEHLTFAQATWTLNAWKTVLQPNGVMEMIVPDMLFHIQQWMNPDRKTTMNNNGMTDEEWALAGFWGWQRETEKQEIWDIHKTGYDYPLLKDTLEKHGFRNVEQVKSSKKNLHVKAVK